MLIIIHGWSDDAKSFKNLAKKLAQPEPDGIGVQVAEIYLGDYVSLDDDVTFNDLVSALDKAWNDKGLKRDPRSYDVVVHSTGGLVIRDWLTRYFIPEKVPIKRLLMLAPANFGSPLAHTGRSVFGRAIKGWRGTHLFETGSHILKGLELASPYSWDLAGRDIFSDLEYYGSGNVLCTVLVGNSGYTGIAAMANKPGSDGTVRVSTANLNAAQFTIDFTPAGGRNNEIRPVNFKEVDSIAFGIMDGENHSAIAAKEGKFDPVNWKLICKALRVEDKNFSSWQSELTQHNSAITEKREKSDDVYYHSYQNTVVRVVDNHGAHVSEYVLEFYINDDKTPRDKRLTQRLQEIVISKIHKYGDDNSYRNFLINCTELRKLLDKGSDRLNISITALPEVGYGKVGYKTYRDKDIGALSLSAEGLLNIFKGNRTLLITLKLQRYQHDSVFRFKEVEH